MPGIMLNNFICIIRTRFNPYDVNAVRLLQIETESERLGSLPRGTQLISAGAEPRVQESRTSGHRVLQAGLKSFSGCMWSSGGQAHACGHLPGTSRNRAWLRRLSGV